MLLSSSSPVQKTAFPCSFPMQLAHATFLCSCQNQCFSLRIFNLICLVSHSGFYVRNCTRASSHVGNQDHLVHRAFSAAWPWFLFCLLACSCTGVVVSSFAVFLFCLLYFIFRLLSLQYTHKSLVGTYTIDFRFTLSKVALGSPCPHFRLIPRCYHPPSQATTTRTPKHAQRKQLQT